MAQSKIRPSSIGNEWELIWENPSPTSSFAAQIISLNLAKYGWVKVEARLATAENDFAITMDIPVGTQDNYQQEVLQMVNRMTTDIAAGEMYAYSRGLWATESGVTFLDCTRRRLNTTSDAANSTQNARVVPLRIWGKATSATAGGDASFRDAGFGFRKLWENPAPTSSYAAATVPLDLSEYDAIYTDLGYTSGIVYAGGLVMIGGTRTFRYPAVSGSNLRCIQRSVTASTTGVSFSDAQYNTQGTSGATTGNTNLIPHFVIGVKFNLQ